MKTDEQLELVGQCLANLGKPLFVDSYLELIASTGAVQVNIYSCTSDKPDCLLLRNFDRSPTGELTTSIYLSGWYQHDPMLKEIHQLPIDAVATRHLKNMLGAYPQAYKDAFQKICKEHNHQSNLSDKLSVLAVGTKLKLIVNIYFSEVYSLKTDEPILSILGRLALQHFESEEQSQLDYPKALCGLSDRERQVCLGILSGKKAERIADDIEVAPSTVVTYRRRAYEKLGISSRACLFEICNG